MSLLLNIDTTGETAIVNVAENGTVLFEITNSLQHSHAAFVQPAVQEVLAKAGIQLVDIDAVAVSHGPGSYTGIRVGMASAKGLCYAAGKPLIVVSQLEILAKDYIDVMENESGPTLVVPMIDARRMEVFTAAYDKLLSEVISPAAMVLEHGSFSNILLNHRVAFTGSGAAKWQQLCDHPNASFATPVNKGLAFSLLSFKKYSENDSVNLTYAEPLYIKDFFSPTKY